MNKPWVEDFYGEKFIPKIIEIERWFSQKMEKQNNLKSFEVKNLKKNFQVSDFTGEAIEVRIDTLKRLIAEINRIPRPPSMLERIKV